MVGVFRVQRSQAMSSADGVCVEHARTITSFGFSDRQARFLNTVMLHSGVFVGRQYAAFAGITHGQKVHDFIEKVLVRRLVTPIELGSTGRTRIFHVHHKTERFYARRRGARWRTSKPASARRAGGHNTAWTEPLLGRSAMEIEWPARLVGCQEGPEVCRPAVRVEANDACERCVYRNWAPRMASRKVG